MNKKKEFMWLDDEGRIHAMLWFVFNQLPQEKRDEFWREWPGVIEIEAR